MEKSISLIKELRLFMALMVTVGGSAVFNWEVVMQYVYMYNIHLGFITIVGIYINHFLSNRRHKYAEVRLDSYQKQLNQVILDSSACQLKAEVRQVFKDYHGVEVIDFLTTVKYLRGLEDRRIKLGINSYTEDMMQSLLNKIDLSGGHHANLNKKTG